MTNEPYPPDPEAAESDAPSPSDGEPFPCPHCGQMLAPACRVCVACHEPIDPAQIRRPPSVAIPWDQHANVKTPLQPEVPSALTPALPPVRYPWRMFLLVLAVSWAGAVVALEVVGMEQGRLLVTGVQVISSLWVFFDARQKRLPKPLHWGLGTLFLWVIVFPWYLVRRRTPESPCPFVEREASPLARVLLAALALFFLVAVVVALLHGPG